MNKPININDQALYNEPGSWGRLSEGWPETGLHAEAKFALCGRGKYLPYGSYVLARDAEGRPVLRVATQSQLDDLNATFAVLHRIFRESRL